MSEEPTCPEGMNELDWLFSSVTVDEFLVFPKLTDALIKELRRQRGLIDSGAKVKKEGLELDPVKLGVKRPTPRLRIPRLT